MPDTTNELTAADAMQVVVKSVPSSMSLPDLERELLESGISGVPVVDDGELVGVVSRSDVVRQICSERETATKTSDFYFDSTGFHEEKVESFKDIADRIGERIEGLSVRDVMVRHLHTVAPEIPISRVARQFDMHGVHRFPVTEAGQLIGIITTLDLVRLIATKRLK